MSLSFVSSAVQTGTESGGYEETPIESKESEAVNRRNAHKPLFEQLRANQEEEQSKRDEIQREMMRGTRALDEDDVAHLDDIEKQRTERERQVQEKEQAELAMFRAAKAMRQQSVLDNDESENDSTESDAKESTLVLHQVPRVAPAKAPVVVPVIKVKKRKRRIPGEAKEDMGKKGVKKLAERAPNVPERKNDTLITDGVAKVGASGCGSLSGLLSGYGSSSDEE
jgi:hypothetical protein